MILVEYLESKFAGAKCKMQSDPHRAMENAPDCESSNWRAPR
jgi:hypothetical protein